MEVVETKTCDLYDNLFAYQLNVDSRSCMKVISKIKSFHTSLGAISSRTHVMKSYIPNYLIRSDDVRSIDFLKVL